MVDKDPIGSLTGAELDQAFSESVGWLRANVGYDPIHNIHYPYKFEGGSIGLRDREYSIFQVKRYFEGGCVEKYTLSAKKGLIIFEKEETVRELESSILGTLTYNDEDRYFIDQSRAEQTMHFGPQWLERVSEENSQAKLAVEEKKRAALRIVTACQQLEPIK